MEAEIIKRGFSSRNFKCIWILHVLSSFFPFLVEFLTVLFLAQVADFEPRGYFIAKHSEVRLAILSSSILLISAVLNVFDRNTDCIAIPNRSVDELADFERNRKRFSIICDLLEKFNSSINKINVDYFIWKKTLMMIYQKNCGISSYYY